jgi:TPR repeat protein
VARLENCSGDREEGPGKVGAEALCELGLKYSTGREVGLDLVAAHKWFNIAALRGSEAAKRYRLEIASEMSKAEIARAQRLAREWLSEH